jgi:hypothetical protein
MEDILVPLIVFGFIALIVKMGLDYSKWKQTHKSGGGAILEGGEDKSLGVSELRMLIQEAVHSANVPLMERISILEGQQGDEKGLLNGEEELKQLSEPAPERKS